MNRGIRFALAACIVLVAVVVVELGAGAARLGAQTQGPEHEALTLMHIRSAADLFPAHR